MDNLVAPGAQAVLYRVNTYKVKIRVLIRSKVVIHVFSEPWMQMKICGGDLPTIPSTYIFFVSSCRASEQALIAEKWDGDSNWIKNGCCVLEKL